MKIEEMNRLADAPITERQKMAVYLALQVECGNMTQEEAIEEAKEFNKWMIEIEKEQ